MCELLTQWGPVVVWTRLILWLEEDSPALLHRCGRNREVCNNHSVVCLTGNNKPPLKPI